MTSTVFTSGTVIESPWLNDVNTQVYAGPNNSLGTPYLPAGTGAVATTVQTKLQESVSVKDFGAVGNGTTNDTTAIQACATYCTANSKTMYIPAGTYKITTAIVASCSIRGDGPKVSIIKNY